MDTTVQDTLHARFGFETFLDGQQAVIEALLRPASAVAIFPTGAGKSLCYQLAALHLAGLTLVVSPLLSLMKDQIDFLVRKQIPAARLDSSQPPAEQAAALKAARNGNLKILMVSVERFKNERFRLQLARMQISLMVVDEAHCISEWGHNFRPDYLKLPDYQKTFNIPHVLLLTATATPAVVEDMCAKFGIPAEHVCTTGFYRQNLHLNVIPARRAEKDRILMDTLAAAPPGPSIVYVTQRETAERIAAMVARQGVAAEPYHAGMQGEVRQDIQDRFMRGHLDVVVATIAFGMGIDKSDIRKVIHYDLPKSIESYSQEIGRAGRDGEVAVCSLLGDRSGLPALAYYAYGDTPEAAGIRTLLEKIKRAGDDQWKVRLTELSLETDIRILPLKTLLVYLEMKNIIRPLYVYFEAYAFKLLRTEDEITANFSAERKIFVETLFATARKARIWVTPDLNATAARTNSDRSRVVAALDYFAENGWIELKPRSSVEVFAVIDAGFDLDALTRWLFNLFLERERFELERIRQMIRFFETSACLPVALSAYFGETLPAACGVCAACRANGRLTFAGGHETTLSQKDYHQLTAGLVDLLAPPVSSHQITRYLCGISTPRLICTRAVRLEGFGCLSGTPFPDVLDWVRQNREAAGPASPAMV